jgi:hypothetical protein
MIGAFTTKEKETGEFQNAFVDPTLNIDTVRIGMTLDTGGSIMTRLAFFSAMIYPKIITNEGETIECKSFAVVLNSNTQPVDICHGSAHFVNSGCALMLGIKEWI